MFSCGLLNFWSILELLLLLCVVCVCVCVCVCVTLGVWLYDECVYERVCLHMVWMSHSSHGTV